MSSPAATIEFAPGIYPDVPEDVYHRHPALSASGAKKLLPPSCPAIFYHERIHGRPPKREFDIGHAAHALVLGAGPELHVVGADNYRTKAAQQERDAAYARGDVPLTPDEFDAAQQMAAVLRAHPRYDELFGEGTPEQSIFWTDPETGVACRARPDWLNPRRVVDYKTTASDPSPEACAKAIANFGYHIQEQFYRAGLVELDLIAPDADFVFVFQQKTPPYIVTVVEIDERGRQAGYEQMRQALEIFRDCTEAGVWPTYSTDIETVSLPSWALRRYELEPWL
jgi:hypothetical protein